MYHSVYVYVYVCLEGVQSVRCMFGRCVFLFPPQLKTQWSILMSYLTLDGPCIFMASPDRGDGGGDTGGWGDGGVGGGGGGVEARG